MSVTQVDSLELRYRRLAQITIALMALGALVGVAVPAGFQWDFGNFYDAGQRIAAGQAADLYHQERPIDGAPPHGKMQFWGVPLSAALYAPLALLPPMPAMVVFKLAGTLACALSLLLLYRFNLRFVPADRVAGARFAGLFCLMCLLFQPLWTVYRTGGQTTPFVLLLLVAGLSWYTAGRFELAALAFVLAVTIKPALITGFALLVVLGGRRFFLSAAGIGVALALLSVATIGWDVHAEFIAKMLEGLGWTKPWTYNSSLFMIVEELHGHVAGPDGAGLSWLKRAIKLAVVAAFVALLVRRRVRPLTDAARRHCDWHLALLFFLLISGIVWEHYLALLLPFLVYLLAWGDRFGVGPERLLAAIAVLAIGQNLVIAMTLRAVLPLTSLPVLAAVVLYKGAPLLLVLFFLYRYREAFLDSHERFTFA